MLFYLYISLYLITDCILLLLSWIKRRNRSNKAANIGCTIIVPLIDDTRGLVRTLSSIVRQGYKTIEVIVVINGPEALFVKTRLMDELDYIFHDIDIGLLAVTRKNKANAINKALKKAKYDWYCIIDSDCTLTSRKSLTQMMRHVGDGVIAVGGRVCVANPKGLLGRLQKIEYNRTFMCLRNATYRANAVTIISGAYGVFNRSIVLKAGGYTTKHVGEDMDITLKLQRYCRKKNIKYRVEYDLEASINTKVPLNIGKLFRQRDRWMRGLVGSFLSNITFGKDKKFAMRYIAQPYMLIFEIMAPVVFTIGIGRFVYYLVLGSYSIENFALGIGFLTFYMLVEAYIDMVVEIRRCRVDRERFNIKYIWYALIMQVPMMGLQSVLMIAKLYGMVTYPFRKRVW